MRPSPFPAMECPVARSLAEVGDGWRVLILRDALLGFSRFDDFERDLGIAPNILSKRLQALVEDGLLVRRPYQSHPLRHEYVPTQKAQEFSVVLAALASWGTRWLAPEGPSVMMVDNFSGEALEARLVGRDSGAECATGNFRFKSGPNAGPETLNRVAQLRSRMEQT